MKAPEKLYVSVGDAILDIYSKKESNEEIEYIRTDAFIEKACEFISLNVTDYIDVTHKGGDENITLQESFIDVFKKYIRSD